jgi:putative phosphoesterase
MMKKLIVISDSHGNAKEVSALLPLVVENDYLIHLGDGVGDIRELRDAYPDKVYFCAGNCDFYAQYPAEGILEADGARIFYCHGHKYGVKQELLTLALTAKERGCDIALYGHTHEAKITELEGVTLINPGTLRYAVGKGGSYCYLVIHKGKATPVIVGDGLR